MKNPFVEVKHKPIYHGGKAYGVGSIINAPDKNVNGALLAGGCVPARDASSEKFVKPEPKANLKPATKAARGKPKASASTAAE